MAKRIEQTRFKLVIIGLALGLVEGLLRSLIHDFPVVEAFAFQGGVIGWYFSVKTSNNNRRIDAGGEK